MIGYKETIIRDCGMLTGVVVGEVESSLRKCCACLTSNARCLDKGRRRDREVVMRTVESKIEHWEMTREMGRTYSREKTYQRRPRGEKTRNRVGFLFDLKRLTSLDSQSATLKSYPNWQPTNSSHSYYSVRSTVPLAISPSLVRWFLIDPIAIVAELHNLPPLPPPLPPLRRPHSPHHPGQYNLVHIPPPLPVRR